MGIDAVVIDEDNKSLTVMQFKFPGKKTTISHENIRLYEYDSRVNAGINRTATSTDQADMFYFYNNGVVFICDEAKNSPASNEITFKGVSIVNGSQSLNVLYNAWKKGQLFYCESSYYQGFAKTASGERVLFGKTDK